MNPVNIDSFLLQACLIARLTLPGPFYRRADCPGPSAPWPELASNLSHPQPAARTPLLPPPRVTRGPVESGRLFETPAEGAGRPAPQQSSLLHLLHLLALLLPLFTAVRGWPASPGGALMLTWRRRRRRRRRTGWGSGLKSAPATALGQRRPPRAWLPGSRSRLARPADT